MGTWGRPVPPPPLRGDRPSQGWVGWGGGLAVGPGAGQNLTLAQSQAQARALDAADGVMDGQHFGSKIGVDRRPASLSPRPRHIPPPRRRRVGRGEPSVKGGTAASG